MTYNRDFDKDLEFIRDKFEQDGLQTPDSLSADAIRQKLAGAQQQKLAGAVPGELTGTHQEEPASPELTVISAPDSSTDQPLQEKAEPKKSAPWYRRKRPLIAAAACVLLAICLIPAMKAVLPDNSAEGDPAAMTADNSGVYQFSSYDELDQTMKDLLPDPSDGGNILYSNDAGDVVIEDGMEDAEMAAEPPASNSFSDSDAAAAAPGGTAPDAAAPQAGAISPQTTGEKDAEGVPDHSSTYTQVEGIDEADIVKTDGKYIYYLSDIENQIIIARAKNGKAKRVGAVSGSRAGAYLEDMYIQGDKLIIIGSARGGLTGNEDGSFSGNLFSARSKTGMTDATIVAVYDISDRTDPQYMTQYSQTGFLLSSRLIDDRVCLVTNDYIYSYRKGRSIPYVSYDSGKAQKLPIGDIGCIPQTATPAYTVVGLMDLSSGKSSEKTVRTKAVLGGSSKIYCNGDHLYVAGLVSPSAGIGGNTDTGVITDSNIISEDTDVITDDIIAYGPVQMQTQILKISLADGKVKYESYACVEGDVNNQFSMDETNGTFKVATTSQREDFITEQDTSTGYRIVDINNLFIFDENMKEIGSVIGFAKDEHIEAVRYIKDKAYVITYEQTDPLFIIDLSDPTEPVIEGHVKISGFSTLLVPADQDHLLGLGFSTESTQFGEATDGVKLALFDISDPALPVVADSKACPGYYSPVQYDHKALLVGPAAAWYAIPYDYDSYAENWDSWDDSEESETRTGVMVFSAKAGHLKRLNDFTTKDSVRRCIYIGDYIYAICGDDSIEGFHLD